jgi:hypothetical protein
VGQSPPSEVERGKRMWDCCFGWKRGEAWGTSEIRLVVQLGLGREDRWLRRYSERLLDWE